EILGLNHRSNAYWNLRPATLVAEAIRRGEGALSDQGALVALTGKRTGRSPKDKFVVREPGSESDVHWGEVNVATDPAKFDAIRKRMLTKIETQDLFVQDLYAGADPKHRLNVRMISEYAWHSLFVRQLFIRPGGDASANHKPDFTVIDIPS